MTPSNGFLPQLVYDVTIYKDHMTHTKKTACESVSMTMCIIDVHTLYSRNELAGQKYWISLQAKVSGDRSIKSEETQVREVNTGMLIIRNILIYVWIRRYACLYPLLLIYLLKGMKFSRFT